MKRFMHMEDNEDGTMTATVNDGEEEISFVMPMSFDDFVAAVEGSPEAMAMTESIVSEAIIIPNQP